MGYARQKQNVGCYDGIVCYSSKSTAPPAVRVARVESQRGNGSIGSKYVRKTTQVSDKLVDGCCMLRPSGMTRGVNDACSGRPANW